MVLTSHTFAGKERCDCFRSTAELSVENRFYRKVWPSGEVTLVTYFTKTAWPVHGHTFRDGPPPVLTLALYDAIGAIPVDWSLNVDALIAKLMGGKELFLGGAEPLPPPTIVLYNEGVWNSGEKAAIDALATAMVPFRNSGVRFQWKTTTRAFMTAHEEKVKAGAAALRNYALQAGLQVLDAFELGFLFVKTFEDPATVQDALHTQWKELYPDYLDFYWDAYHFQPFVYTIINRRWLQQLIEEG